MSFFKNPYCLYICILFIIALLYLLYLFFIIAYGIIKEIKSYKAAIKVAIRKMKKIEKTNNWIKKKRKMKIPETYEEFLKTPKKDLYELSKMDIPLEVASRIMKFICKADEKTPFHICANLY